jgi:hypothetical protein
VFIGFGLSDSSFGQSKQPPCGTPAAWLVKPKFTDSDIAKWKDKSVTATVVLQVSESGDVIKVGLRSVKPKEAGPAVLSAVQLAKFAARSGCGNWTMEITFNLGPDALHGNKK